MRVWRRWLFELGETSWSALLIQYLLLLKAFYLEPRFVPLIVNPRKYQHVQNQQTASDRDRHAQSCRVRGIPTKKKRNINLSFASSSISLSTLSSKTNTKQTLLRKYSDRDLLNDTLPSMHTSYHCIFEFHHHSNFMLKMRRIMERFFINVFITWSLRFLLRTRLHPNWPGCLYRCY